MSYQTQPKTAAVHFELSFQSPGEALTTIGHVTDNFQKISPDVAAWVNSSIRTHQFVTYGYLPAPTSNDAVKIIIGQDGFYLKLTTQTTGINFIWHDRHKNIFMFWGNRYSVVKAMHAIRNRIEKYGSVVSVPAVAAVATVATIPTLLSDEEVESELAYYERQAEIEQDRESEEPVYTVRCSSVMPQEEELPQTPPPTELLHCPSSWTDTEHVKYGLEYLRTKPELEDFVRDFDEPMGFSGSDHPLVGVLHEALSREIDSGSSFSLYLRVLQEKLQDALRKRLNAVVQKAKKEMQEARLKEAQLREAGIVVNRCVECQADMGPDNPRQLCRKTYCENGPRICHDCDFVLNAFSH
jgi:hypothetical protein